MANTFIKNDLIPESTAPTNDMALEVDNGATSNWVSLLTLKNFFAAAAVIDNFTIALDGDTIFALSKVPASDDSFSLYLNGQRRLRGTDFTQVGTVLTWLDPAGVILLTTDEFLAQYNDAAFTPSVTSVFGRTGVVIAALNDYLASQVDNDSSVPGATVKEALDSLGGAAVSSVFGRSGVVVALPSDYDASQIDNDSLVPGAFVDDALNTLRTKEVFLSARNYGNNLGTYRTETQGSAASDNYTFYIPDDFGTLVSFKVIGIPSAGAAGAGKDIDLSSEYGTLGEASNFHSETDTTTVYDLTGTSGQLTEVLDLSVVLTSLAAGDFLGMQIDHMGIGGSIDYIGFKLIYTL